MSNTWRWLKPAPGELSGAVHQMERELSKEYGRETGTGFPETERAVLAAHLLGSLPSVLHDGDDRQSGIRMNRVGLQCGGCWQTRPLVVPSWDNAAESDRRRAAADF